MTTQNSAPNGQQDETLEKSAEAVMFAKVAAQEGIDLRQFDDEQLAQLWNITFSKTAEEEETKAEEAKEEEDEKEEEKKEAAAREHSVKLAHAQELQRADELGERIAKSYLNYLHKYAEAQASEGEELDKEAGIADKFKKGLDHVRGALGKQHGPTSATPPKGSFSGPEISKARLAGRHVADTVKEHKGKATAAGGAAIGAGAFAAGRASKKKEASHLDGLALEHAVKLAHAAGFDPEEAADRVLAVNTLGLEDSTKVAQDLDGQVHIRALEFLEAAGYPVTWPGEQQPQA